MRPGSRAIQNPMCSLQEAEHESRDRANVAKPSRRDSGRTPDGAQKPTLSSGKTMRSSFAAWDKQSSEIFFLRRRILYKRQESKIPGVKKWSDDWGNGKGFCRIIRVLSLDAQFCTSLLSSTSSFLFENQSQGKHMQNTKPFT